MRARPGTLALAAAATIGLMVATPTPDAAALGTAAVTCDLGVSTNGGSSQSLGGYTTSGGNCGYQSVRVSYKTYAGSPVYWTSWKSGKTYIKYNPGNTIIGAEHFVDDAYWAFQDRFPFST